LMLECTTLPLSLNFRSFKELAIGVWR